MKSIFLLLLLVPGIAPAQNNAERCITLAKIYDLIQQEHYKPRNVDDSLAVFVFDEFINVIDPSRVNITKDEYNTLLPLRLTLDDHIRNMDCSFMNKFETVYRNSLLRRKMIIEKLQSIPFDYNSADSIAFSKERFNFDLAISDLEYVWNKRLRYEVLEDIAKKSKNRDSLFSAFHDLEKISREKIFDTNLCRVNSELSRGQDTSADLWSEFLNIFCTYFDPHTNYFSQDTKSSFISSLSTSNLSLGISVGLNEHEEIVIEEIIPGGPAALTKQIDKNDVIVSVLDQNGVEHRVSCESFEIVGEFLFSDLNKVLGLTLRKQNGSLQEVHLEKIIMPANENTITGFIAELDGIRAGYIALPNFYSSFEPGSSAGCSEDVAAEIYKLSCHHIDGLILDLQGNGGGSMDEAIRLAGMFVEGGAISVLADRFGKQVILHDMDPGIIYDGPLVVLIDGNSASASEFFASAMQDYRRAVVAGSPSLGKASMQTLVGLDGEESTEFVKLTIQKFYRVTGESAQITGVIPDVRFPTLFEEIIHREAKHKNALAKNVIKSKAKYERFDQPNLTKSISQAIERVKKNPRMNALNDLNKKINTVYLISDKKLGLTFDEVFGHLHENDALWDEVKAGALKESAAIVKIPGQRENEIINNADDFGTMQSLETVRSNPFLDESLLIIGDLNQK
jgi:carboxyl-terminal processing protease